MPANKLKFQERRGWAYLLAGLYVVLIFLLPLLAHLNRPVWPGLFLGVARVLGLVGFSMLALQVVLGSRLKFIDRPWGLDAVMRFHKWAAIVAVVILLLHPAALLVTYVHQMGLDFSTAIAMLRAVYGGIIALTLLLLVVLLALARKKLGIEYQLWRYAHKGAIAVVALGFFHGLRSGAAMPGAMQAFFWALLVTVALVFLYQNVYMKLWGRSRWRITDVTRETPDTYTLSLASQTGRIFHYRPGQFVFLKLMRPGRVSEEHPFTISSAPTGTHSLTVTIKESGDFTDTIGQTRPGDQARIEGPFGRFSFQFNAPSSFIFIAGGVGITPLLSMMRYLRDTGDDRHAVLIYGNHSESDIIARHELDTMPDHVKVVYVLESPPDHWTGAQGYINADVVGQYAGDQIRKADIYLCGPPPMMQAVTQQLRSLGIPRKRIHSERFTL